MILMNKSPPYFYHPLRVICLDDNQDFLDALEIEFAEKFDILTFTDPKQTLEIISKNSNNNLKNYLKLLNNQDIDLANSSLPGINFGNVLDSLYSQKRFEQIAILIVDYEMPSINGIEICEKLNGTDIFKIMLTAEADKDTAINAFNNSLIDKFILKTSKNLHSEISSAIYELVERYFFNLSTGIGVYNRSINLLYKNPSYINLFLKTLKKSKSVEHYLIDNSGSILFLDKDANPTWLLIKNSEELQEQLALLSGYDFPSEIISTLFSRKKMLYLFSESDYKKPVTEWIKNLWDSEILDDRHYYSIINEMTLVELIDWSRVVTYESYKNQA